ncbi:MAG: hypothetical protein K6F05_08120 [Succinivibrio sp.]|nr:hypothetical protein [Succinivibrio sp.]
MGKVTVALDGMGGDSHDPQEVVRALRFAFNLKPSLHVRVFGSAALQQALSAERFDRERISFVEAPENIPQDASPKTVLRNYQNSALAQAIEAVRAGDAQAVVSSGGTGPLVTLARHHLGCIGNMRPALAAKIPGGTTRFSLMLDLGANASCSASDLYDFARLAHCTLNLAWGIPSPRLCVLNVGSEQEKGNKLVKSARDLILADQRLNCGGFVEANRLFCGDADVILSDGFTGNVALKAAEGVAHLFAHQQGLKRFFALLAKPEWLQPWHYNGSILLGVRGNVLKSHASATSAALGVAIVEASKVAELDLCQKIAQHLDS